jgi:hypothetical protein
MGRKKTAEVEEAQPETRKARKLDVEALRSMADTCPSKSAGELLIEAITEYTETRIAYQSASKRVRQAAALAKSSK